MAENPVPVSTLPKVPATPSMYTAVAPSHETATHVHVSADTVSVEVHVT